MKSKSLVILVLVFLLVSSVVVFLGSKAIVSAQQCDLSPFPDLYGRSGKGLYSMHDGVRTQRPKVVLEQSKPTSVKAGGGIFCTYIPFFY